MSEPQSTVGSWRRRVRGFLLLPHLVPVLLVELATLAFAVIAWGGVPPIKTLLFLMFAMLGGQLAIGALNELVDLPVDAIGKPSKPLPSGDVTVPEAQVMVGVGLALMTVCGLPFGPGAFTLLVLGTGLGFAYDLWLKWTIWSWLPYFLALPLLPIWVFTALGRPETLLVFLYPLGALSTVGVHFAQALPDVAIDRSAGSRSLTSRLGQGKTFLVSWLAVLSAPALAWIAATWTGIVELTPIEVAAAASVLFFATNLGAFLIDRRLGATTCFPFVALSALISGLAWAIAVAR